MRLIKKVAFISIAGSLLLWAVELAYAVIGGALPAGTTGAAALFLLLTLLLFLGWGAIAGIAQCVYLSALAFFYRQAKKRMSSTRAKTVVALVVSGSVLPYIIYFTLRLFSGAGISKSPYVSYFKVSFIIAGILFVFLISRLVTNNLKTWFSPANVYKRLLAVIFALAAMFALYSVNAAWYVGQYDFVHQAVGIIAFLLAEFTMLNLFGAGRCAEISRGRTAGVVIAALFLCPLIIAFAGRVNGIPSPGSQQLSYLYTQSHLGKQLMWIYDMGEIEEEMDASYHQDYLADRDEFLRDAGTIDRQGCNFIWIMVDALRADHLPMHGYRRNTAPNLKGMADRSILFLHNYTQGPNTGTSLSSQMTGCYTSTLHKRGRIDNVDTLAEMLLRKGYQTWAIAQKWDIDVLGKKGKEGVAFDRVIVAGNIPAPEINKEAIGLLNRRDKNKPFFLFLFYYEPHDPYDNHAEFGYGDRPVDFYDSEISYFDRQLAKFFEYLLEEKLDENTIVLLTADHGDEIGQHGGWGHHWKLYDCLIHVPFILYMPGLAPMVIHTPIHAIDMCPSIVELLGLETETRFDGSSFIPYITKGAPPYVPRIFSEAEWRSSNKVCVNCYPWKLVYHMSESYYELFNLEDDPREKVNRVSENAQLVALLKNKLLSWISYRDSGSLTESRIENPGLRGVRERLVTNGAAALKGLEAFSEVEINEEDFKSVKESIQSCISRHSAAFLIAQAKNNPAVRREAIEALATLVRGMDSVLGGSDHVVGETYGTPRYAEAEVVFDCLTKKDNVEFILSLVSRDDEKTRSDCLEILGMLRQDSTSDTLYAIYEKESDSGNKEKLFQVLCRLGDSRVEEKLLKMVEGVKDYHKLKPMIPLFANYRSEKCREFLLDRSGESVWYLVPLVNEIGKTRNSTMLPVLKEIFSSEEKSKDVSHSVVAFSRKMAIKNFVMIKGRENLSVDDKRAIREAYENDPQLRQYRDIRELYE